MLTAPVAESLTWNGTNITVLYPTENGYTTTHVVPSITSFQQIVTRPVEDVTPSEVFTGISEQPQNVTGDYDSLLTTVAGKVFPIA